MTDVGTAFKGLLASPHLAAARAARWRRKLVKLLRQPVRFFDDARDEGARQLGFRILFLLHRYPVLPSLCFSHLVRWRWRVTRGAGARLSVLRGALEMGPWHFEALDKDPQFEILGPGVPLPRGPIRIFLHLEVPAGGERPKIYMDTGKGFRESLSIALPLDSQGKATALCVLPLEGQVRLRLDPCGMPGTVRIRQLELRPLAFSATLRELQSTGWPPADARRYLLTGQTARPRSLRNRAPLTGDIAPVLRPGEAAWQELAARPPVSDQATALVDVVVPVYDDADTVLACLYSVLSAPQQTPFALTVIDDCGPDMELREELGRLSALGLFTLLRNEQNLGFVRTANRGMRLSHDRDVVLLNADAEVYNDWLDRLRGVAGQDSRIATVTPLTNDGEIASYPYFVQRFPGRLELPFAELDRLAAACNAGQAVSAPTGVGFCFYIRRTAIDAIGFFDANAFGAGYGEENDFCIRAHLRGWRNVLAPGVFVRHVGGVSFGVSKARRVQAAMAILAQRYPFYRQNVDVFLARDPMAPHRSRLDEARLQCIKRRRTVLAIVHRRGGGTEAFLQDRAQRAAAEGTLTLIARPARNQLSPSLRIEVFGYPDLPNLPELRLVGDWSDLVRFLRQHLVERIELHNLVGYDDLAVEEIPRIARALEIGYEVFLHDYQALCPRINLVKPDLSFCDVGAPAECSACLRGRQTPFFARDIGLWRRRQQALLQDAAQVLAPSQDTADRFQRHFTDLPITVAPHPDLQVWDREQAPALLLLPPRRPGVRRICLLGGISEIKGLRILAAVASLAQRRRSPVEFVVVGECSHPGMLNRFRSVYVTERYDEAAALPTLRAVEPDLVWFPAIWPETFSYTLSIAFRLGLPVLVPDLGALTRLPDEGSAPVRRRVYPHKASAEMLLALMESWPEPAAVAQVPALTLLQGGRRARAG